YHGKWHKWINGNRIVARMFLIYYGINISNKLNINLSRSIDSCKVGSRLIVLFIIEDNTFNYDDNVFMKCESNYNFINIDYEKFKKYLLKKRYNESLLILIKGMSCDPEKEFVKNLYCNFLIDLGLEKERYYYEDCINSHWTKKR
ncbi:MAG: hypothetical protein ACP5KG_13135, partial [Myxococcota bacterium]